MKTHKVFLIKQRNYCNVDEWVGGYEETVVTIWRLRKNGDFRIEPHIVVPDEDYADFLPEIQRTGIEIS